MMLRASVFCLFYLEILLLSDRLHPIVKALYPTVYNIIFKIIIKKPTGQAGMVF